MARTMSPPSSEKHDAILDAVHRRRPGLYFKALTEGLATMPPVPAEVRQRILEESASESPEVLHRRLAAVVPEDAARIRRPGACAALEVFEATGRALPAWTEARRSRSSIRPRPNGRARRRPQAAP